jgi:hypothetical protein
MPELKFISIDGDKRVPIKVDSDGMLYVTFKHEGFCPSDEEVFFIGETSDVEL